MKRLFICTLMTLGILASLSAANPYGGKVTCNGKGVPGVIVTDGIDCVTTGKDGAYTLERNRGARFICLSTPAGYQVACKNKTIGQFYQKIDPANEVYNFELAKKNMLVLPGRDESVVRATANIAGLQTSYVNTLNVYDILKAGKIILTQDALKGVEEVYA